MLITAKHFEKLTEQYAGYCSKCDKVTKADGVEPDAISYTCPECEGLTLMGMGEALIQEFINIK